MFSATRWQVATYLLAVCPFSIAFLVFLNSSVSFVVTDLIGDDKGVGDAVGTLGFADELLALIACPIWGLLSDRIGVRSVCLKRVQLHVLIMVGVFHWLHYCRHSSLRLRAIEECIPSVTTSSTAFQSGWVCSFDDGHSYLA